MPGRAPGRRASRSTSGPIRLSRQWTWRIGMRSSEVGEGYDDLAVEAAGPQQGRVERCRGGWWRP